MYVNKLRDNYVSCLSTKFVMHDHPAAKLELWLLSDQAIYYEDFLESFRIRFVSLLPLENSRIGQRLPKNSVTGLNDYVLFFIADLSVYIAVLYSRCFFGFCCFCFVLFCCGVVGFFFCGISVSFLAHPSSSHALLFSKFHSKFTGMPERNLWRIILLSFLAHKNIVDRATAIDSQHLGFKSWTRNMEKGDALSISFCFHPIGTAFITQQMSLCPISTLIMLWPWITAWNITLEEPYFLFTRVNTSNEHARPRSWKRSTSLLYSWCKPFRQCVLNTRQS